jgi:hypothetical protein
MVKLLMAAMVEKDDREKEEQNGNENEKDKENGVENEKVT